MFRHEYYEEMKRIAREVRAEFDFTSPRVRLSDLRKVYRDRGIRIDLWAGKLKNLRGAYFNDESGASVMIAKKLPKEQRIFTMGHELKHHIVDRTGVNCMDLSANEAIEIGAEVFAVELIFPEADFAAAMRAAGVGVGACSPEDIVRLKRQTETTLSFTSLAKLATHLGFAAAGTLDGVQWKKLEVRLYGEPLYKQLLRRRGKPVR